MVSWPAYEAAKITGQRNAQQTTNNNQSTESEAPKVDKELQNMLDGIKDEQRSMKAAIAKGSTPNTRPWAVNTVPPETIYRRSLAETKQP